MPTYSYFCNDCKKSFELFFYIKDYSANPGCPHCSAANTYRKYIDDIKTQSTSVKKSDTELKTLGDLAKRNSDRLSEDEKRHLHSKHNDYKYQDSDRPLPTGMSRIKKPPKTQWPGAKPKTKRKPKNG